MLSTPSRLTPNTARMRMHSTLTGEMCSIVSNPQPMSNPLLQESIMLPGEAAATTLGKGSGVPYRG